MFSYNTTRKDRIIEHIKPMGQENDLTEIKKQIRRKRDDFQERKTNYYCLNCVAVSDIDVDETDKK